MGRRWVVASCVSGFQQFVGNWIAECRTVPGRQIKACRTCSGDTWGGGPGSGIFPPVRAAAAPANGAEAHSGTWGCGASTATSRRVAVHPVQGGPAGKFRLDIPRCRPPGGLVHPPVMEGSILGSADGGASRSSLRSSRRLRTRPAHAALACWRLAQLVTRTRSEGASSMSSAVPGCRAWAIHLAPALIRQLVTRLPHGRRCPLALAPGLANGPDP